MAEAERAGPASLPIRLTFRFGIADRPEEKIAWKAGDRVTSAMRLNRSMKAGLDATQAMQNKPGLSENSNPIVKVRNESETSS